MWEILVDFEHVNVLSHLHFNIIVDYIIKEIFSYTSFYKKTKLIKKYIFFIRYLFIFLFVIFTFLNSSFRKCYIKCMQFIYLWEIGASNQNKIVRYFWKKNTPSNLNFTELKEKNNFTDNFTLNIILFILKNIFTSQKKLKYIKF